MTGPNLDLLAQRTKIKLPPGVAAEQLAAFPYFVVMRDEFLSGWGEAENGASLYVLACADLAEAQTVAANAERRSEMRAARIVSTLTASALGADAGDVVSFATAETAEAWYRAGAFAS